MIHPEQYLTPAELAEPFSYKRWIYQPDKIYLNVFPMIPNRFCSSSFVVWREEEYERFILKDCGGLAAISIADVYAMLQDYDGLSLSRD